MAESFKILAQNAPAATTLVDFYTVPASTNSTISSFTICNRGGTATTFRISTAIAGANDANSQYVFWDQSIDANSTFIATIGITLAATDKIRVYAGNANLTFIAFGVEVN